MLIQIRRLVRQLAVLYPSCTAGLPVLAAFSLLMLQVYLPIVSVLLTELSLLGLGRGWGQSKSEAE